jgi:surface carbohydrate biosynthesis protein
MQRKIIYLPIETKVRDYHARLLFGLYAVKQGYQVIIGSHKVLHRCISLLPHGLYVGTALTKLHYDLFDKVQKSGHKVVAFDEEGLIYINKDDYMRLRVNEDTIKSISYFFTWGEHHGFLVREKDHSLTNYSAVGNMRFELLKAKYHDFYKNRVQEIKRKFGKFILVNTSFANYNNIVGMDYIYPQLEPTYGSFGGHTESLFRELYEHEKANFMSFQSLLRFLAPKLNSTNIVVRPHPAEKKETWESISEKNVFVEKEGSVIPWILAADAIIQSNCTTAVETVCIGKPLITYNTNYDPRYDNELIRKIGRICESEEDVAKCIADIETDAFQNNSEKAVLKTHVSNMGDGENVAWSILGKLDDIDISTSDDNAKGFIAMPLRIVFMRLRLRRLINAVKQTDGYKNSRSKFPQLRMSEFIRDASTLSEIIGVDSTEIKGTKLFDKLFHLTSK